MALIVSALVLVSGFFGLRVASVLAQAVKIQRDVASLNAAVRRVHTAQLAKKAAKKS
jgi:hypothetical protein